MKKLEKGSILYDIFSNLLCDKFEDELVKNYEFLGNMRTNYKKLYNRLVSEYERDFVKTGKQTMESENDYFEGIYYFIYLFVAWIDLNF